MVSAIIIGSLLSSAGAAAATATATAAVAATATTAAVAATSATFLGVSAATFSAVSLGLGALGTVGGMLEGKAAASAQAKSMGFASDQKARELEFQTEQERAQSAIADVERERKLRRILASQTAAFAGGAADPFSGSPVRIQEDTESISRREGFAAKGVSALKITQKSLQKSQELRAGAAGAAGVRAESRASNLKSISSLATQGIRAASLIKTGA